MHMRALKLGDVTAEQDLTIQENIITINCQIIESVLMVAVGMPVTRHPPSLKLQTSL